MIDGAPAVAAWRRWRGPLSTSVLDQAAVSGANFALHVLLARWTTPAEYGAFAVAYSVLLLASAPHGALLTDPLTVVGPRRFAHAFAPYLRTLVGTHFLLTLPVGVLLAASALLPPLAGGPLTGVLFALGAVTPFVLLVWLLRSACYLEARPGLALTGSGLYALTLVGLMAAARVAAGLTGPGALVAMGAANALASVPMAAGLGLFTAPHAAADHALVIREHWAYGRWILGASVAHAVGHGLYIPLVGAMLGLDASGALRAIQNLVLPLQQVLLALGMLTYPWLSRGVAREGPGYLWGRAARLMLMTCGAAAAYGAVLAVVARPALSVLYGNGRYTSFAGVVPIMAAAAVVASAAQLLSIFARALGNPQVVLWSKLAAGGWLLAVGIVLIRSGGIKGAVVSLAGSSLAEALVLAALLWRRPIGAGTSG